MIGKLCRFMVKNGGFILHFKHHHIIEFIKKGAKSDAQRQLDNLGFAEIRTQPIKLAVTNAVMIARHCAA